VIRVELYNLRSSPRARLTIITGDRSVCTSAPVRPWLRLSGWWFLHSRKNVQAACRKSDVIVPSDDEIHAAIEEAWNAL